MKIKLLAAAVALVAATGANAAMEPANTANGGSMILVVGSKLNNISAAFDLGYDAGQFLPATVANAGANVTWNLTTNVVAPNSFSGLAAATGNDWSAAWSALSGASDLQWGVIGYQTSAAGKNFISTASVANQGLVAATTTTQFGNAQTGYTNFLNFNNTLGTQVSVANGASTATATGAYAYQAFGTGLKAGTEFWSFADAVGTSLNVNLIYQSGATFTKSIYAAANAAGPATFSLSSAGVLTYDVPIAAVPEPETYGMLAAGLLMLGAVARRRNS